MCDSQKIEGAHVPCTPAWIRHWMESLFVEMIRADNNFDDDKSVIVVTVTFMH